MRKRSLIAVVLLAILGLGMGVLWWVQTPTALGLAVDLIAAELQQEYGLKLQVGNIEADVIDARIVVRDISVRGQKGEELFSTDRLLVELTPMQLLTGRLRLDRIELDKPQSRLSIVGGRISGLPAIEGDGPVLFKISVAEMQVKQADIDIAVDDSSLLSLRDINVNLQGRAVANHVFSFSVGGGSLDHGERRFKLSAFSGQGEQEGNDLLAIGRVNFERVIVGVEQIRAELAGSVDFADRGAKWLPATNLELQLDVPLDEVRRMLAIEMPLAGWISVDALLAMEAGGDNPRAEGFASVTGPLVDIFNLGDGNAYFEATADKIDVKQYSMAWGSTVITGDASVLLDAKLTTKLSARGRSFCFGEVLADMSLTGSWVNFFVDADVTATGQMLPSVSFQGHGYGNIRDFAVNDRPYLEATEADVVVSTDLVQMTTDFAFDPDKFTFSNTVARDGLSVLNGGATLNFDIEKGLRVEVESEQANLISASPVAAVDFSGIGKIRALVHGPYPNVTIEAQAEMQDFVLERYSFGDMRGDIHYHDFVLSFLKMSAQKGSSEYKADVVLDFNEGVGLAVEAALAGTNAEDLRALIPDSDVGGVMEFLRDLPLTGALTGRGVARGNISGGDTSDLTGSADLTIKNGSLFEQTFASGLGQGRLSLQTLFIDNFTLSKGVGTAHLAGTVVREDGTLRGKATCKNLPLDQMEVLDNQTAPVVGVAHIEADLSGTVTHILGTGSLKMRQTTIGPVDSGNSDFDLTLDGRELQLAGPGFSGRGLFAAQMTIRSPFPYQARLEFEQGPLAELFVKETLPATLVAKAAGSTSVRGKLKEISNSRGTLRLNGLTLRFKGLDFATAGQPAEASFVGSDVDIERLQLHRGSTDNISIKGRIGRKTLSVEVESDLGMDLVPAFTDKVSVAQGRLKLNMGVSGSYADPVLLGQGTVSGGHFVFSKFEHPVENFEAHLLMTRDKLLMDTAEAIIDGARVEAQGALTFAGFVPKHLQLSATAFDPIRLHVPESVASRIQGTVELAGDFDDLYLRGDVEVLSALYTETWDVERILPEFRRRRLAPHNFDPTDELLHLDLRLHADDNLIIRNNLLNIECKGDVRLTGTNERPGMRGTVNLLHGHAQFRGNRYDLERATIDLVAPYKLAPVFDVLAHTQTHGARIYDIDVYMQGPLEDLRIRLQSRPELAEIDILSLITLGFTREDIRDVGTTTTTAALEVLGAYSGLDREVKRVLPLPVHEVRLSSLFSESQGTTVPSVVVGIELLEGLQLQVPFVEGAHLRLQSSLMTAAGGYSDQRVELDIRLNDRTSIRGILDNDAERNVGDPGVDFNYRLEF